MLPAGQITYYIEKSIRKKKHKKLFFRVRLMHNKRPSKKSDTLIKIFMYKYG